MAIDERIQQTLGRMMFANILQAERIAELEQALSKAQEPKEPEKS